MPIYDYECLKCLKQREVNKPLSQLDREEKCCKAHMVRVIQTTIPFTKFDMQRRESVKRVMKKKLHNEWITSLKK